MQKFLNTLWEFTGLKEDKDNFSKDQKRVAGCSSFQGKCNHIEGMEKD